ncbi:toprim domain-containing protein [Candidatus Bathyarchaeota archaeon]|nr:toprim domain-containing protein [Candidatus Bathyarchaeota archaeon]
MEEAARGIPIIVEGLKDAEGLRRLGLRGKIIPAKMRLGSYLEVVEEISNHKEVVILTDFDRRGEEMASILTEDLEGRGVKVNLSLRWRIASLIGKDVKDVEGLASYIARHLHDCDRMNGAFEEKGEGIHL